jgi:3-dehydrosphinganine reductase
MTKLKFQNKTILITGASRGIGQEIARQLAEENANLILVARGRDDLEKTADLIENNGHKRPVIIPCDISNPKEVEKLQLEVTRSFKSIFGLINNAGITYPQYFSQTPLKEFEKVNAVDYLGSIYVTKAFWDMLEVNGFLTFTSSVVGYMGVFGYSSYAGPKFALIGLAETLEQELLERNISVSVLCPPDTETPGFKEESKTKPFETQLLSKNVTLMSAKDVAHSFLKQLKKRQFLIMTNFESRLMYHLHRITPTLVRSVMKSMVKSAQKKIKSKTTP